MKGTSSTSDGNLIWRIEFHRFLSVERSKQPIRLNRSIPRMHLKTISLVTRLVHLKLPFKPTKVKSSQRSNVILIRDSMEKHIVMLISIRTITVDPSLR